jgi:hypothetical protein
MVGLGGKIAVNRSRKIESRKGAKAQRGGFAPQAFFIVPRRYETANRGILEASPPNQHLCAFASLREPNPFLFNHERGE